MRIIGGIEEDAIDDWADDGYEDASGDLCGRQGCPGHPSERLRRRTTCSPGAGCAAPAAAEAQHPRRSRGTAGAAEGLPEGWSMEQWQTYGQMWLEQNGRA